MVPCLCLSPLPQRVNVTNGTSTACTFWDASTGSLQMNGCTQIPNPLPPGHRARWVDNVTTPDDDALQWAWNMSGPAVRRARPRSSAGPVGESAVRVASPRTPLTSPHGCARGSRPNFAFSQLDALDPATGLPACKQIVVDCVTKPNATCALLLRCVCVSLVACVRIFPGSRKLRSSSSVVAPVPT